MVMKTTDDSRATVEGTDRRVAIVTGISKGLGLAIARQLVESGWTVIGNARNAAALEHAWKDVNSSALRLLPGDITDTRHLNDLVAIAQSLGRLDLLVNNAGALGPTPLPLLSDVAIDDVRQTIEVNALAPLNLIQRALPLLQRRHGVVVNVSSDAAAENYQRWGAYGASKMTLEKLTSVLIAENVDVRFYILDPGDMKTAMQELAFPGEDLSDRRDPMDSARAILTLANGHVAPGRYRATDIS